MNGDQGYWQAPYPYPGNPYSENTQYDEQGAPYPHLSTVSNHANLPSFAYLPTSTNRFASTSLGNPSHVPPAIYYPHPSEYQSVKSTPDIQQLRVNTRLSPYQVQDSGSSTTSSASSRQLIQTPFSQMHLSAQPYVQTSPLSAPAELQHSVSMLDLEKMLPFPPSPLTPHSASFEEDIFEGDRPLPPHDEDTEEPLPHIIEWKRVIEICRTGDHVPQRVYQPYTEADRKRYIREVVLQNTIFFYTDNSSEPGILLEDALKQKLKHLKDKDAPMFVGCGPSVSIRLQWPGYAPWSKQIPSMDFKNPKGPITRAKLAKNIANCVRRFSEFVSDKPMEADSDRRWKFGKRHIKVEDLILVSLHHVSKGSWQPQLRLRTTQQRLSLQWDEFLAPP